MANLTPWYYLSRITTRAIIESLTKDGRFKSICKRIAKKPYLADDLYQEFFLALCEIKDERLIEAKEGGYLEVLCVGVINNIWGKRYRVKMRDIGQTHPLHEHCNGMLTISFDNNTIVDNERNDKKVPGTRAEKLIAEVSEPCEEKDPEEIKQLIDQSMNSEDPNERFNSRVFYYSMFKYKSPLEFHRESGIPARVCYYAYNNFRDQLKQKLCIS